MHRLIQQTPSAIAPSDEGGEGQDDRGPAAPIVANDRELLMRFCTRGDEAAFAELVERHSGLVWVAVWQVLRHRQDVEDAFQATFLILARRSGSIRGRDSIAGWLHRVAFRTALAVRRKRGDAKPLNGEADTLVAPEAEQLAAIGLHEERSLLLEELRALPERYQLPITLCYLEQRTRGEAADELGLSVAAVKGRLARGKQMLRARLARRGVGLSTAVAALAAPLAEAQAAVASGATAALASAAVSGTAPVGVSSGALEGVSESAIHIAHQGAKAMALNAMMKPAAAVFVAATLGVAGLVASEPEDQPALGGAPGRSAINLQVAATEAAPPKPPAVVGFTAPEVVDVKVLQAGPQTSSGVLNPNSQILAPVQQQPADVRFSAPAQPLQSYRMAAPRVVAPTGAYVVPPKPADPLSGSGRKRLQLELDHWQLRAEGLRLKADAEEKRGDFLDRAIEQGEAPAIDGVEAISARAEAMLLRADAKAAEAKVIEIGEQLEKPTASVTFPQGSDPRLYSEAKTANIPQPGPAPAAQPILPPPTVTRSAPGLSSPPVPSAPLQISVGDALLLDVSGLGMVNPFSKPLRVEPTGTVALGPEYGRVQVVGKNVLEAEKLIVEALTRPLKVLGLENPNVSAQVVLQPQSLGGRRFVPSGSPEIVPGQELMVHAVSFDRKQSGSGAQFTVPQPVQIVRKTAPVEAMGTIALGAMYGRVKVAGLTIAEAEEAILEALRNGKQKVGPQYAKNLRVQVTAQSSPRDFQTQPAAAISFEKPSIQAKSMTLRTAPIQPAVADPRFSTKNPMSRPAPTPASFDLPQPLAVHEKIIIQHHFIKSEQGETRVMVCMIDDQGVVDALSGMTLPNPMNGKVKIVGMTPEQASKKVEEHLRKEWPDSPMRVTVRRMSSSQPETIRSNTGEAVLFRQHQQEERALTAPHKPVRFVEGPRLFREGDSIEITKVLASSPRLEPGDTVLVSGRVRLGSREAANLSLYLTQTEAQVPTRPDLSQILRMTKGTRAFTLKKTIQRRGALHLTFYDPASGKPFGGVYFGTKKQMNKIADWDLGYYLEDEESPGADSTAFDARQTNPYSAMSPLRSFSDPFANVYSETPDSTLMPGDDVFVVFNILGQGHYVGQQRIGPDGTINGLHGLDIPRPVDDRIKIASKSREQAAREIQDILKKHLPEMQATVEVRVSPKPLAFRASRNAKQPVPRSRLEDPRQTGPQSAEQAMRQQAEEIAELQAQLAAREAAVMKQVHRLEAELRKRDTESQKNDALVQEMLIEIQKRTTEKAKQQAQAQKSIAATQELKAELAKLQAELAKRDEDLRRLKESQNLEFEAD